ncbi:MAG: hypothetical protein IKH04_00325 [Kiritimatiellae bacterium]|nr:hypothetical protein [Kiritimatiellia bacterium]
MNYTRTILAALAAATALCAAHAQEAAPASPEDAVASPEDAVANEAAVEPKSVHEIVDEYLDAKGYSEGENTKKDGSSFYVAVGYGAIQAPLDSRSYTDSRVNAYNKAMLDAKAKMAEYLEISIRTETERDYSEGNWGGTETTGDDELSIDAKVKRLIMAKLDKEIQTEGLDPNETNGEARERAARKRLNSEFYKKVISTAAKAEITGMQVMCSFEGVPSGKKGEIGVVAIWSPKLQAMAQSISRGGKLPSGVGKRPVKEQIPSDKKVLLSTFGVQQKIDENGNLVLVAFGQAGAVTDSPQSANAARNKAKMQAMAAIREFAGETVAVTTDAINAENVEEFENAAESYENVSAYSEKVKAVAESLKISGIATIKNWEAKHPLTGNTVYGAVCTWSPDSAARAHSMKRTMDAAAAGAGAARASQPVANPNGSIQGQGADADEDAF